jgi:hypothetical protein
VCQSDLAHGRGGLAQLQLQRTRRELQLTPAQRDGAGGHEHHLLFARAQAQQVFDEAFEPGPIDLSAGLVDEQRRTDFDDDPAGTS